jgi:hypothetical protein
MLGCTHPGKTAKDDAEDEPGDGGSPSALDEQPPSPRSRKLQKSLSATIKRKASNFTGRVKKITTKPKEMEGPEMIAFMELVQMLKQDPETLWPLPPRMVRLLITELTSTSACAGPLHS